MSAVSFAVAPTVSFRSSSWISPSTEPSISRSQCRRCRLSHAGSTLGTPSCPGPQLAAYPVFSYPRSDAPKRQHTPRKFPAGRASNSIPPPAHRNSLRDSALPGILLLRGGRIKARRAGPRSENNSFWASKTGNSVRTESITCDLRRSRVSGQPRPIGGLYATFARLPRTGLPARVVGVHP